MIYCCSNALCSSVGAEYTYTIGGRAVGIQFGGMNSDQADGRWYIGSRCRSTNLCSYISSNNGGRGSGILLGGDMDDYKNGIYIPGSRSRFSLNNSVANSSFYQYGGR